jgi:hypothetical protein
MAQWWIVIIGVSIQIYLYSKYFAFPNPLDRRLHDETIPDQRVASTTSTSGDSFFPWAHRGRQKWKTTRAEAGNSIKCCPLHRGSSCLAGEDNHNVVLTSLGEFTTDFFGLVGMQLCHSFSAWIYGFRCYRWKILTVAIYFTPSQSFVDNEVFESTRARCSTICFDVLTFENQNKTNRNIPPYDHAISLLLIIVP